MRVLIDTHCHLDEYDNPRDTLAAAEAVGVGHIIAVGMHSANFAKVLDLARQFPAVVRPALGIHPEEVKDFPHIVAELPKHVAFVRKHALQLVGIAEIGLDHHFVKDAGLWPLEETIFREMLAIAEEFQLPVSLHVKDAEDRVLEILQSYQLPGVVIHWFSGPDAVYRTALDRGYYFSVPQAVRYSPRVRVVAAQTPLEQLLLESDGPATFSGVVGEPRDCAYVAHEIAKMRKVAPVDLEKIIETTTRKVFPRVFAEETE